MRFGHVILYVKDVVKTVEFYEKAFGLQKSFVDPSNMYAQMETGQTALSFAKEDLATLNIKIDYQKNSIQNKPSGFEISFIVKNVEEAFKAALEKGCLKVADPEDKPWGQKVAYVRDLNGVIVEIASEMEF